MTDAGQLLQQLGFSDYEARAYMALLQHNPLNGYELAKVSGIPRANIYAVLQKLEQRNAVLRLEQTGGTRYTPVAPHELTRSLGSQFQVTLDAANHALEALHTPTDMASVLNVHDYAALLDHASALIEQARTRLLLAIVPEEAGELANALAQAQARGIEIHTLCLNACVQECGGCRGQIYRYRVAPQERNRWLIVIADEQELLTGDIDGAAVAQAVRTRQHLLVAVASWYIRQSVALAALLVDLGASLDAVTQPETRTLLQALGLDSKAFNWPTEMRGMLGYAPNTSYTGDEAVE